MIYCGVQLYPGSFKIVALSEGFALIDEQFFHIDNHCDLTSWINSLKADPLEEIQWFFDEGEFNNKQYPAQLFHHLANDDDILLVNHRKLINIIQFFYEWMAQEEIFHMMPTKAFVLASAPRIFSEQELVSFYPDDVSL
jgi:hypothetical protein